MAIKDVLTPKLNGLLGFFHFNAQRGINVFVVTMRPPKHSHSWNSDIRQIVPPFSKEWATTCFVLISYPDFNDMVSETRLGSLARPNAPDISPKHPKIARLGIKMLIAFVCLYLRGYRHAEQRPSCVHAYSASTSLLQRSKENVSHCVLTKSWFILQ